MIVKIKLKNLSFKQKIILLVNRKINIYLLIIIYNSTLVMKLKKSKFKYKMINKIQFKNRIKL